ncbi:unnamed protein product [Cylindrotheca closterium]|uniref:Uncharacterized protein n=1 Tax=Cylindrotheca closterium TaxID=2856 RepID=A0AAD2FS98_9STRA|nr:unnamed protein product [Cylindrotheca closterium]
MDADSDLDQEVEMEEEGDDLNITIAPKSYCKARLLKGNTEIDIPSDFMSIDISGRIGDNCGKVEHLLRLLNDDSRRWKDMTIEGDRNGDAMSQAFLSVVGLAMTKCKSFFCLQKLYADETLYQCLMSGLTSPLCVPSLDLCAYGPDRQKIKAKHLKCLAEGIAQTTALKDFSFCSLLDHDAPIEDISGVLVDGIARNNTIQHLEFESRNSLDDNLFPCLMKALQRHPKDKLESLSVRSRKITMDHVKDLVGYIGHKKCSMKKLRIKKSELSRIPREFHNVHNTSLKQLCLSEVDNWSDFVSVVCPTLSSLSSLTIIGQNVTDLAPLDNLLCDESALTSLTQLHLTSTALKEEALSVFASKLLRMKHLRTITLSFHHLHFFHPRSSKLDPFLTMVQKSKSLEYINLSVDHPMEADVLCVLNLNKAGRRGLETLPSGNSSGGQQPLDIALWPMILNRCLTLKYAKSIRGRLAQGKEQEEIARDNLFLILRDHAYIFDAICDKK